jgi:hypothetical protein
MYLGGTLHPLIPDPTITPLPAKITAQTQTITDQLYLHPAFWPIEAKRMPYLYGYKHDAHFV